MRKCLWHTHSWQGPGTDTQGFSHAEEEGTVPWAWLSGPRDTHIGRSQRGEKEQPSFTQNPEEFGSEPGEASSLSTRGASCPLEQQSCMESRPRLSWAIFSKATHQHLPLRKAGIPTWGPERSQEQGRPSLGPASPLATAAPPKGGPVSLLALKTPVPCKKKNKQQ